MNFGKIGKFNIQAEILKAQADDIRLILAECLIIRCEMRFDTKSFEYIAFNEAFDFVGEGAPAPEYRCLFTLHTFEDAPQRITHVWERVE